MRDDEGFTEEQIDALLNPPYNPFKKLFGTVSPEEFVFLFGKEAMQTRAFLLSFAPDAEYAEKVTALTCEEEFDGLARDYLSRVETEPVDAPFVRGIENHVNAIIGKQENKVNKEKHKPCKAGGS